MSYEAGFDSHEFVDMIHLYEVDVKDNFDIDLDEVDFSEPSQKCYEHLSSIKLENPDEGDSRREVGSSTNVAFSDIACFNGQDLDSIDEKSLQTLFREVPLLDPEEYLEKDEPDSWDCDSPEDADVFSIECKICSHEFLGRNEFLAHSGRCFKKNIIEYTCKTCRRSFTRFLQFRDHCLKHVPSIHRCLLCDTEFASDCSLVSHISSAHSSIYSYSCDDCGLLCPSDQALSAHRAKDHWPTKGYACNICNKVLLMKKNLSRHLRLHASGKLYMCEVCGKLFLYKMSLVDHLANQHAVSKPYRCHLCPKWFPEKSFLLRHQRVVHCSDRPYVCNICNKAFKTNPALNTHSLTHSFVKRFHCSKCNKGFIKISKLKEHENVHTGRRPYKCRYCIRSFTNSANLLKHTKRKHKESQQNGLDPSQSDSTKSD